MWLTRYSPDKEKKSISINVYRYCYLSVASKWDVHLLPVRLLPLTPPCYLYQSLKCFLSVADCERHVWHMGQNKNKNENKNRRVQMAPRSYLCLLSCQQLPCLFKTLPPTQSSLIWFPGRVCLVFLWGILALPASSEQPGWLANNSSFHTHHHNIVCLCMHVHSCFRTTCPEKNLLAAGWRAAPSV